MHAKLLSHVLPVAKEVGLRLDNIFILDGHVKGRMNFDDFVRLAQSKRIPRVAVRPAKKNTLAYLVFSSGTSGLPKGTPEDDARWTELTPEYFSCDDNTQEPYLRIVPSKIT